ncbi:hypothetical protein FGO68_gene8133 [Halteria grandinella]|uniref:Uncharacterized protein n=1 Tax=Halteria grandinella TaxID=5974 RepID=A0A8J8P835_HALGN|nr:hypothetical protein FGO68_gene8133 [Halteria grandinella]
MLGLALTSDATPQAYVFSQLCDFKVLCEYRLFRKTQSTTVTWAIKSVSYQTKALGMSLQESIIGRVAIIMAYESPNFTILMIDGASSTADVLDAASYSIGFNAPNSFSLFTQSDKIVCAFTNQTAALYIFTTTITTTDRKFDIFNGRLLTLAYASSLRALFASGNSISILAQSSTLEVYFISVNFNTNAQEKQQIPRNSFTSQILGNFISSTSYLVAGSLHSTFNTTYAQETLSNSQTKGVIMSNCGQTLCYPINDNTIRTYSLQTQISLQRMTQYTTTTTVAYYEGVATLEFQDLLTQYLVSIQTWCSNKLEAFTVDSSQPQVYAVKYGVASFLTLTPFSYCGALTTVPYLYSSSCMNCTLSKLPTGLSITNNFDLSMQLHSSATLAAGSYKLRISITIPGISPKTISLQYNFVLQVIGPPYFASSLATSLTAQIGVHYDYTFPTVNDKYGYSTSVTWTITDIQPGAQTNCPTTTDPALEQVFNRYPEKLCSTGYVPPLPSPLQYQCIYTFSIILTNSFGVSSTPYLLLLTLINGNQPPFWLNGPPGPAQVHLGQNSIVDFSGMFSDPNQDALVLSIQSSTCDASLAGGFKVRIKCTDISSTGTLHFSLTEVATGDAFKLEADLQIDIFNDPPSFEESLTDQIQAAGIMNIYYLPKIIDAESPCSDPIDVSVTMNGKVSNFISYQYDGNFLILDGSKNDIGQHIIDITLTDSLGSSSSHSFVLIIQEKAVGTQNVLPVQSLKNKGAPYFVSALESTITIEEGKTMSYVLPQIKDPDYDGYYLTVKLGEAIQFVSYSDYNFDIRPLLSQVSSKPYIIQLILTDDNKFGKKWISPIFEILVTAKFGSSYVIKDNNGTSSGQGKDHSQQQGQGYGIMESISKFKALNVTSDAMAKLKVIAQDPAPLINQITNKPFSIYLVSRESLDSINYTIDSKASPYVYLKLNFQDPYDISISQDLDQIMITSQVEITSKESKIIERIRKYSSDIAFVPIQLTEAQAYMVTMMKKSGDAACNAILSTNLILNISLQVTLLFYHSL